jgi:glycosyltransferase involved in cell wall biosynthesis
MKNKKSSNTNLDDIIGKSISFIGQKGVPAEFTGTSGVEFYVEYRACGLVKKGISVTCYVRNWATPKDQTEYCGINLIHLPTINTKHLDTAVHALISSVHACFTNTETVWYQASGPALFSFIPKFFGKKIIVTIHTLEWKRDKWGPFARLVLRLGEQTGAKTADSLVAVSEDLADYLMHTYNRRVVVDLPIVNPVKRLKPDIITKKYGLKSNDYVLYLGRFVPEKRIEWLVAVYKQIKPMGIKLVLAGGSSHSDIYENTIKESVSGTRPSIAKSIILTGYVFGQEKQELLCNCRALVLPSSLEGNPTVVYEASEYDKPCVVSDRLKRQLAGLGSDIIYFNHNSIEDLRIQLEKYLLMP